MKSTSAVERKRLALPVVLMTGLSEEFFLGYPKALMEFIQSLKMKKTMPKMSHTHYHVHYYPIPLFPPVPWKAPDKYYLDEIYSDTLASFGWSDYRYEYTPNPSLIFSSNLQQFGSNLWDDPWKDKFLSPDDADDRIDPNSKGLLVQVPVNRQLVFHLPLKKSQQKRSETVMA